MLSAGPRFRIRAIPFHVSLVLILCFTTLIFSEENATEKPSNQTASEEKPAEKEPAKPQVRAYSRNVEVLIPQMCTSVVHGHTKSAPTYLKHRFAGMRFRGGPGPLRTTWGIQGCWRQIHQGLECVKTLDLGRLYAKNTASTSFGCAYLVTCILVSQKQYRKLSLKYHPDKNSGSTKDCAQKHFIAISKVSLPATFVAKHHQKAHIHTRATQTPSCHASSNQIMLSIRVHYSPWKINFHTNLATHWKAWHHLCDSGKKNPLPKWQHKERDKPHIHTHGVEIEVERERERKREFSP